VPGTRVACFIALDGFGAEVLGCLQSRLDEGDRADLLHAARFFWGGITDRPEPRNYWSDDVPVWSLASADQEPFQWQALGAKSGAVFTGQDEDDGRLANAVRADVSEANGLPWLVGEYLARQFGTAQLDAVNIILVGSVADADTQNLITGYLAGSQERRKQRPLGVEPHEFVVTGIGHHTCDSREDSNARARAGASLLRIQEHLARTETCGAVAVFAINEQVCVGEGVVLDRRSQVEIAAAVGIGLIDEAGRYPSKDVDSPLRFRKMPLQSLVTWGPDDPAYDREKAFVYCSGAAVQLRSALLTKILAAGQLEAICRQFIANDPDGPAAASTVPISQPVLDTSLNSCARATVAALHGEGLAPAACDAPWRLEGAEAIADHIVDRTWRETQRLFGAALFGKLALEDWQQALDDLDTLVAEGLASRLSGDLVELRRRLVSAFDEGLEAGYSGISQAAWQSEVGFAPRRHCRAALEHIREECRSAREDCELRSRGGDHLDSAEIQFLREQVLGKRNAILRAMDAIPSPQSLLLRVAPACAAFVALAVSLPVDLGPCDPWPVRVAIGLGLAAVPVIRSYALVANARSRLLRALEEWASAQRAYYQASLRDQRWQIVGSMLEALDGYATWLLEPDDARAGDYTGAQPGSGRARSQPDFPAKRRRFLNRFARDLEAAAARWAVLRGELIARLQAAKCVHSEPPMTADGPDFSALPGTLPAAVAPNSTAEILRAEINNLAVETTDADTAIWLLQAHDDVSRVWSDDALMPDGSELLQPDRRRCSPAFGLFERAAGRIARTWSSSLREVVAKSLAHDQAAGRAKSLITFLDKSMGPIAFDDRSHRVSLAMPGQDPLVADTQSPQALSISGEFHFLLDFAYPLSAHEVIFLGDSGDEPRTHLARATIAARTDPSS
jgi:hypothetical protein